MELVVTHTQTAPLLRLADRAAVVNEITFQGRLAHLVRVILERTAMALVVVAAGEPQQPGPRAARQTAVAVETERPQV